MASYSVHPAGVARARELIAAKQYVLNSEWGDVQPSAADGTAYLGAATVTISSTHASRIRASQCIMWKAPEAVKTRQIFGTYRF